MTGPELLGIEFYAVDLLPLTRLVFAGGGASTVILSVDERIFVDGNFDDLRVTISCE